MRKLLVLCTVICCLATFTVGCKGLVDMRLYENADAYTAGNYISTGINEIEIYWAFGSINVETNEANGISITESDSGLLNAERMHYFAERNKLIVQFCKSGYVGNFLFKKKDLTVKIPKNVKLYIEASSADVNINDCTFSSLDVETSSGNIVIDKITGKNLDVESSSGEINVSNAIVMEEISSETSSGSTELNMIFANKVEVETTSGSINVDKVNAPIVETESSSGSIKMESVTTESIDLKSSSGSINIDLLDCARLNAKASSGSITIKLNGLGLNTLDYSQGSGKLNMGDVIVGSGKVNATIKTTSGNINFE